ncbi:MAG TPA: LUD domain-containing protein [Candidatus Saccharimonadales bacterium]|nr:LUD domain-containing protein [Candidatus Saccharimonadales bacterium]
MPQYNTIADNAAIDRTKVALEANGFAVTIAEDADEATKSVLAMLPKGAEVFTVTSQTLSQIGLDAAINDSGDYDAVRPKLFALMNQPEKKLEQRKLGAAPEYVVGSVHALTQDGHALVASATGSQLPAYTFGAAHVIWVVGAQKIVKDDAQAEERLRTHVFPLENERSKQAYSAPSEIRKLVHFYKELPGRIHVVIVKQTLGF